MVRRPLALTAATTIALGGLFFAAPAYAADEPKADATLKAPGASEDAPSETVNEAAAAAEVVAFGVNAAGEDVVVVAGDEAATDDAAVKAFTDAADITGAKVVTIVATPKLFAGDDIVGGQGYLIDTGAGLGACSVGFSAFSPEGVPALLSAGHCSLDFNSGDLYDLTALSVPSEEPAVGGPGFEVPNAVTELAAFTFGQFGGPNNTTGAQGDVNATDIAVMTLNEAGDFNPLPAVTNWTTAGEDLSSLAEGTVAVKSVGAPVHGDVSKSGRTTGFTTGTIDENDLLDGWAKIEDRWVRGFSSDTVAGPGDSGGAVIQGTTAVGLISGGVEASADQEQWTWATSLVHGLEHTNGYTVALDVDAPTVTDPASGSTAIVGSTITGKAPGAKTVRVSGVGDAFNVSVSNGEFSFKAPGTPGDYDYKLVASSGYSKSETTSYSLTTKFAPTATPVITSPADGASIDSTVTAVSGTGLPGAEVVATVNGTEYTTTVDGSGNWTIKGLELKYGKHSVSVVQTANDDTSDAATSAFSVVPVAPAVTSITNGTTFAHDNGPSALSGTGIDGATVTVKLNGAEPAALAAESGSYPAEVVDGKWTVKFDAALQPGSYTVSATQSIEGVASAPVSLAFLVLVEPAPAPTTPPAPEPTTPPAPGGEGGNGGEDDNLATTGTDMIVPLSASAGALVLLAGGITLLTIRRRKLIEG
ncbi:hypothetical protein [Microbacterium sp. A94]|uniref:hypothetical protein n=1 Tax=Microbacterium sp. A94 TaxID=3450717 RepID=UPI003F443A09